jgi:hypothetical protein
MAFLQDFLSRVFDQRGGTWVGVSTAAATFMALTEFVTSGFKAGVSGWHPAAPLWFVAVPAGVYIAVLTLFVVNKGSNYYMDSRYNSPPDQRPAPKE